MKTWTGSLVSEISNRENRLHSITISLFFHSVGKAARFHNITRIFFVLENCALRYKHSERLSETEERGGMKLVSFICNTMVTTSMLLFVLHLTLGWAQPRPTRLHEKVHRTDSKQCTHTQTQMGYWKRVNKTHWPHSGRGLRFDLEKSHPPQSLPVHQKTENPKRAENELPLKHCSLR